MTNPKPLVVIATGSSAAIALPGYVARLRQDLDRAITVLMTKTAERFVRPEVLSWFAENVYTCDTPGLNPVEVALTADAVVVLPATGNTLASAALGLMGTPATTALAASPSPCLFFPHMNPVMWDKALMRRHVAALRDQGHTVVEPEAREVFEIWRGTVGPGLSMPGIDSAMRIVRTWLGDRDDERATAVAAAAPR
ncbi:MAG: flavoprotein [Mycobacterium sp.]|nr:flavoprotein [Mycobacterium sp.]